MEKTKKKNFANLLFVRVCLKRKEFFALRKLDNISNMIASVSSGGIWPRGRFVCILLIRRKTEVPVCPFLPLPAPSRQTKHGGETRKVPRRLIMPRHGSLSLNHHHEDCIIVKANSGLIKAPRAK